jgi:hypothetical protein
MKTRRLAVLAALPALILALGACGSEEPASLGPTPSSAPSVAAFSVEQSVTSTAGDTDVMTVEGSTAVWTSTVNGGEPTVWRRTGSAYEVTTATGEVVSEGSSALGIGAVLSLLVPDTDPTLIPIALLDLIPDAKEAPGAEVDVTLTKEAVAAAGGGAELGTMGFDALYDRLLGPDATLAVVLDDSGALVAANVEGVRSTLTSTWSY